MMPKARVQCYVDGFNLYHAISDLGKNHLKWLDLRALMSVFTDPQKQEITDVFYFSAYATWLNGPYTRHQEYVKALRLSGTTPILGHFKAKDRCCKKCSAKWVAHEEKETDVNIAIHLLNNAYRNQFDEAFIVSSDSDLHPAVRMVRENFPEKKIKVIAPPNSFHSKELAKLVGGRLGKIQTIHIERCQLPDELRDGDVLVERPKEYIRSA